MNAEDSIRTAARPAIIAGQKRANAHRRHIRQAEFIEPHEYAESHSPTESVQIVFQHTAQGTKTIEQGRRRAVDARLWAKLDPDMQEAMLAIQAGHAALTAGMGMKPGHWERVSGGLGDMSNAQGAAAVDYNKWFREVDITLKLGEDHEPMKLGRGKAKNRWTLERLSPEAATAIICEGLSIEEVAKIRRVNTVDKDGKDTGRGTRWVRDNLIQSLKVWLYRTNKLRRPGPFVESVEGGLTFQQLKIRQLNRKVENIAAVLEERRRVIRRAA